MQSLNDAVDDGQQTAMAGEAPLIGARLGFTVEDLALLEAAYREGVARRGWGPAQFAANEFSRYLAVWEKPPVDRKPPMLAIIRFDDTGTYALLSRGQIVVSGRSLQSILPALLVADAPARRAA
jgi:hypothetical protein